MTKYCEDDSRKPRNVRTLRTSLIPKQIKLDTKTLVHLLYTKDLDKKSKLLTNGELVWNKEKIWATFFRTDKKAVHTRDYTFNHMVDTNGIYCSVLLIR